MSAFIKLNKQDAFVVPYTAHKAFSLPLLGDSGSAGVQFYTGTKNRTSLFNLSESTLNNEYTRLVYDSINHLYYSNFTSSLESGSYENYNQTTLFFTRSLSGAENTDIFLVTVKRDRFGEAIKPGSFLFKTGSIIIADDSEGNLYMTSDTTVGTETVYSFYSESVNVNSFISTGQIDLDPSTPPSGYTLVSASWQDILPRSPFFLSSNSSQTLSIDNQGITYDENTGTMLSDNSVYYFGDPSPYTGPVELLFRSSSNVDKVVYSNQQVGNIFYTHGIAVINQTEELVDLLNASKGYASTLNWQATQHIYTHNYRCRVREQDLNYSQNPSIKSGSNGDIYSFATGSYFQPYVTTVGLYNDSNELIAVGKLGQPIPKSRYNDMTFVITLDI